MAQADFNNLAKFFRERGIPHRFMGYGQSLLLGYDVDPRQIREIPEAVEYVRWWAHCAGMDDFETANRLVGTQSEIFRSGRGPHGLMWLCSCGVFGDEIPAVSTRRNHPDGGALVMKTPVVVLAFNCCRRQPSQDRL